MGVSLFRVSKKSDRSKVLTTVYAAHEWDARGMIAEADGGQPEDYFAELVPVRDQSIAQLQANLPWGANNYSDLYKANTEPHKQFRHDAIHLAKAAGILLVTPEEMDHDTSPEIAVDRRAEDAKRLADVVIVALHMASTHPSGSIDLAAAIEARLAKKFSTGGNDAK